MKKPNEGASISRRSLLAATSLVLIAPAAARPAEAVEPKPTYGYGYTGGY